MTRILIVDDEPNYVASMRINLQASGYETLVAYDGRTGLELARDATPDLVLLDVKMPDLDGFEVCQRLRTFSRVPIIMLTALSDIRDKVQCIRLGADDYVTKPCAVEEVLARVRALLRRATRPGAYSAIYRHGDLVVDAVQQKVTQAGREVALTPTEFHLLLVLIRSAGVVVESPDLLFAVWRRDYAGDTNLVWQTIWRLRQKLEPDPDSPRYIHTHEDGGYFFLCLDDHDPDLSPNAPI